MSAPRAQVWEVLTSEALKTNSFKKGRGNSMLMLKNKIPPFNPIFSLLFF